jgi:signal peptidase I
MITHFFVLFLLENINMKKSITLMLLCILFMNSYSQTTELWSKLDRNNIYEDCMSYLGKYRNISEEQKESISLCYLDEVTKKYTKQDFQSKIEIEIKRIKEAIINQCAKNLGIELSVEEKTNPPIIVKAVEKTQDTTIESKATLKPIPTKDNLIGRWKTNQGNIVEFKEGGKYSETQLSGIIIPGDWFLDEKGILTINTEYHYEQLLTKKQKVSRYSYQYSIDYFSKDFLKYTKEGGLVQTIQANRVN